MMTQLSPRERVLATVVGGVFGLLLTAFLIRYFIENHRSLAQDLEDKKDQIADLRQLLAAAPAADQRDAWLKARQPHLEPQQLENQEAAGVQLLDLVKNLAKKHDVTLGQPTIGPLDRDKRHPDYIAASVNIEAKSTWKDLIAFLHEIQGPEQFIVFENAALQIDPQDQTRMQAKLRIAKWYAHAN